jgi:hypothetical protein
MFVFWKKKALGEVPQGYFFQTFGNPAVYPASALDPWFCVSGFRQICLCRVIAVFDI